MNSWPVRTEPISVQMLRAREEWLRDMLRQHTLVTPAQAAALWEWYDR